MKLKSNRNITTGITNFLTYLSATKSARIVPIPYNTDWGISFEIRYEELPLKYASMVEKIIMIAINPICSNLLLLFINLSIVGSLHRLPFF